jgi:hypothetical protein
MRERRTYRQTREPDPDYSNEEERKALAEALLDAVPELVAMDAMDGIVEACRRVGFNGLDDACLEMLARRESVFPTKIVNEGRDVTIHLGTAEDALASPRINLDFWENELLVSVARRVLRV